MAEETPNKEVVKFDMQVTVITPDPLTHDQRVNLQISIEAMLLRAAAVSDAVETIEIFLIEEHP